MSAAQSIHGNHSNTTAQQKGKRNLDEISPKTIANADFMEKFTYGEYPFVKEHAQRTAHNPRHYDERIVLQGQIDTLERECIIFMQKQILHTQL